MSNRKRSRRPHRPRPESRVRHQRFAVPPVGDGHAWWSQQLLGNGHAHDLCRDCGLVECRELVTHGGQTLLLVHWLTPAGRVVGHREMLAEPTPDAGLRLVEVSGLVATDDEDNVDEPVPACRRRGRNLR